MDNEMTEANLAKAWIGEISQNDGVVDPLRPSEFAHMLDKHIYNNAEFAWSVIKTISASPMSEWATENFSAGPLSSFISRNHKEFADKIRNLYDDSAIFREHIEGVIFLDDLRLIFGDNFQFLGRHT